MAQILVFLLPILTVGFFLWFFLRVRRPRKPKAEKVDHRTRQEIAPLSSPSKCEVVDRGGKLFSLERKYKRGTIGTEVAPTDADLIQKFKNNVERILPAEKAESAVNKFMELDKLDNISRLIQDITV